MITLLFTAYCAENFSRPRGGTPPSLTPLLTTRTNYESIVTINEDRTSSDLQAVESLLTDSQKDVRRYNWTSKGKLILAIGTGVLGNILASKQMLLPDDTEENHHETIAFDVLTYMNLAMGSCAVAFYGLQKWYKNEIKKSDAAIQDVILSYVQPSQKSEQKRLHKGIHLLMNQYIPIADHDMFIQTYKLLKAIPQEDIAKPQLTNAAERWKNVLSVLKEKRKANI